MLQVSPHQPEKQTQAAFSEDNVPMGEDSTALHMP
jgi:hypothetical protein